jgi:hypothetical protein
MCNYTRIVDLYMCLGVGIQVVVQHGPPRRDTWRQEGRDHLSAGRLAAQQKWVRRRVQEQDTSCGLMDHMVMSDVRTFRKETQWSFKPKAAA